MKATKQHFEATARILRDATKQITKNDTYIASNQIDMITALARDFADEFRAGNPRFDTQRFLAACGFPLF